MFGIFLSLLCKITAVCVSLCTVDCLLHTKANRLKNCLWFLMENDKCACQTDLWGSFCIMTGVILTTKVEIHSRESTKVSKVFLKML